MRDVWRHCSSCKAGLLPGSKYLVCSVSTCNRPRTGLAFCSLECWDAHVPGARHREAWAEERLVPCEPESPATTGAEPKDRGSATEPNRDMPRTPRSTHRQIVPAKRRDPNLPRDVLVVASKLKAYIRAAAELNTSDGVMEVLSEKLRDWCDRAIEKARADGRKTVLDRDFLP